MRSGLANQHRQGRHVTGSVAPCRSGPSTACPSWPTPRGTPVARPPPRGCSPAGACDNTSCLAGPDLDDVMTSPTLSLPLVTPEPAAEPRAGDWHGWTALDAPEPQAPQ